MDAFPPDQHVIRDLAMTSQLVSPTRHVSVAPVVLGPGLLATFVDASAGLVVLTAARPDWSATADLELHLSDHVAGGPLVADVALARAGSRLVVVRATVHDAGGADPEAVLDAAAADPTGPIAGPVVATGVLSFVRMPASRSAAAELFDHDALADRRRLDVEVVPTTATVADRVGARPIAGGVEIDGTPYVRNSMGAVTGGVHALAVQLAAEAAVPGASVTDLTVHFLAAARVGPLRARATVLRPGACDVEVVDAGTGDVVSLGAAVLGGGDARVSRARGG